MVVLPENDEVIQKIWSKSQLRTYNRMQSQVQNRNQSHNANEIDKKENIEVCTFIYRLVEGVNAKNENVCKYAEIVSETDRHMKSLKIVNFPRN